MRGSVAFGWIALLGKKLAVRFSQVPLRAFPISSTALAYAVYGVTCLRLLDHGAVRYNASEN